MLNYFYGNKYMRYYNQYLKKIGIKFKRVDLSIVVGENCFIGARATLLPGTVIGDNCVVGACSVVKGHIPNNSAIAGNPVKIIKRTEEYARKYLQNYNS